MHTYYLILFLLLQIIINCHGQETPTTTTTYNSFTNNITTSIHTTISMPTSLPTTTSDNITMSATISDNTTSVQTTSYSPSPTSFVFTHFPVFPLHTVSSSSIMSSARPSQSAPLPDDTIGKYGRLHISNATQLFPGFFLFALFFITPLLLF